MCIRDSPLAGPQGQNVFQRAKPERPAGSHSESVNTMPLSSRRTFLAALSAAPLAAQYVPKQSDRPEPPTGDEPGFRPIFDGKTLAGWEGDPKYWRVEDGALVGEITPETIIKSNTFIIWRLSLIHI